MHFARGQLAIGLRLMEQAIAERPHHVTFRTWLGIGLIDSAQYERAIEEGNTWQRFIALWVLGRSEEATLLAQEQAASGEDVGMLVYLLIDSGREEEAVRFFQERWESVDAFALDYPPLGRGSIGTLLDLAWAFGKTGHTDDFDDAMAKSREALDRQESLGYRFPFLYLDEAIYQLMAGNRQGSLENIALAVDGGVMISAGITRVSPALRIFDGDPEFEAIQQRMFDHLNSERAELGLEPVEI
jgi:hypothetical protein